MADEGRTQLQPFRQLLLRQTPQLPVVGDLQADLLVFVCVNGFHAHHLLPTMVAKTDNN